MVDYDCSLPKLRTYKGSRYVPLFADPLQWSEDREYDWLEVVYNCGRTYISKQRVPAGKPLPEYPMLQNEYWATYADYNAQIEQYRAEVRSFSTRYDHFFCHLKEMIETLDAKVEQYNTEVNNKIDNVKNELTQNITNVTNKSSSSISNIVDKIYLGGTVDENGNVTWPTADKVAIGNMNWYTGANDQNYIKCADDGDGDMRAE